MPGESSNSGMIYLGNKVTSTDLLLDPMGLRPSIYEMNPNQAERETRYPYNRTYQHVPVNMALAEQRASAKQMADTQRMMHEDGGGGYPLPPQQMGMQYRDVSGSRPPACARQAWTSGRTFRHFRRRSEYNEPNGRPNRRDFSTGDKFYQPKTIERERYDATRTYQKYLRKGPPVRGTW